MSSILFACSGGTHYVGGSGSSSETSYTITISDSITNGTVTASKTSSASGEKITLTVTAESEKVMDTITVKDASNNTVTTTKVTAGKEYTFTMPESNATVTATFVDPYSTGLVGDIVFSDGKFITATNYEKYKEQLTQTAVAVIFDETSKKGVGLQQGTSKAWCTSGANAYSVDTYATSTTDGSANMTSIRGAGDWGTDGAKYPAFAYATSYSATGFTSNWYLPAKDELKAIYDNMTAINTALNKITDATQLSASSVYWSSSHLSSVATSSYAWLVIFGTGEMYGEFKDCELYVRAVRAFN